MRYKGNAANHLWDEPWHPDNNDADNYPLARRTSYEQPQPVVAKGRNTFVPADKPTTQHIESYSAQNVWPVGADVQPPMMVEARVTGNYESRARGFGYVTTRLALAMGGLAAIVGVVGFGVPAFSVAVLLWFWIVFAAVWLAAWMVHSFVSPEGASWLHVRQGWKYLEREQKHRHAIERRANGMDRKGR